MGDDPLARLADIELPAPPHWQPWITGMAVAVTVIAVASGLGIYLWRRRREKAVSPTQGALAQIDALLSDWRGGRLDDREASYRLAALLRLGLGLEQLDVHCPATLAGDKQQWGRTVAALQRLRYEQAPAVTLQEEEFARIKAWIATSANPPAVVPQP